MIQLAFGHRSETLLATLAADIAQLRTEQGPWAPLHLVLPNPCVKRFVLEGLVQGLGVVANQKTYYLEGFWRRTLPSTDPPLRLLDRTLMQGLLLSLLQDRTLLETGDLAPLRHYLAEEPRELKALQLASEVAAVFEAYLLGRPDWAPLWEAGRPAAANAPERREAWQRRLWVELRSRLRAAPSGEQILTFPQYLQDPAFAQAGFPGDVFFFGLGPMARAYHQAIHELGKRCRVRLYLWNPSREPWDDLREEWRQPADSDDPFGLETRGHLALQRWGRPGREHIREVLQLTPDEPRAEWAAPAPVTLLQHLQHSIVTLGTEGEQALPPVPDASIRLHACTGMRREAEAVASAIWQTLLDAKPPLRFSDLAVVLPDATKADYLEHLRVAFASTHDIPWVLADAAPGLLQDTVEAVRLLLGLARTDFSRAGVVCALTHPVVRHRWEDLHLERIAEFCDQAGIVIRFGAEETAGTDQAGGLWTWERGLRRAALGEFLGAAGDGPGDPPPALPVDGAPALVLFLRALLQDLRVLAGLRQSPRAWIPTLRCFLQTYLGYPAGAGREDENQALEKVLKALGKLDELECPGVAAPVLAFRETLVLAEASLESLLAESLGNLGRGVVVATHTSLRGVPFQTRFLMGLGEGAFPGNAPGNPMDLRNCKRRPGDISRAEQDRYLFLESLLACRRSLVLSYVCQDAVTREALQPSPVLLDLRDLLLPALGPEGWAALRVAHPHHRHDLAYFPHLTGGDRALAPNHCGAAVKEAEALYLGLSLRAAAGRVELPADPDQWNLSPEARQALDAWMGPVETLPAPPQSRDRMRISLTRLRKWLECQIQGGAYLRLGLRDEDGDDPANLAEEPLEAGRPELSALRQATLWEALARREAPSAALDRLHRAALEAASMPGGMLFAGHRAEVLRTAQGWRSLLGEEAAPVRHRFGGDTSGRRAAQQLEAHEPITLDLPLGGRVLHVQLEGMTEPLLDGWSLLPSSRPAPAPGENPQPKDRVALLRAWVDHVVLAAMDQGPHRGARVLSWDEAEEQATAWDRPLAPMAREEAREQLTRWVAEALTHPGWTLMPLEGVLATLAGEEASPEEWLESQRDGQHPSFSSLYGPLPRLALAEDTAVEEDWRTLTTRRLGPFTAWVQLPETPR